MIILDHCHAAALYELAGKPLPKRYQHDKRCKAKRRATTRRFKKT